MKKITRDLLVNELERRKNYFATITYKTDARVRKAAGLGTVSKIVEANVQVGASYRNKLEKALANTGQNPEVAGIQKRNWGVRLNASSHLITHVPKGETLPHLYLESIVNAIKNTKYIQDSTGFELSYDQIKEYLPPKQVRDVPIITTDLNNIVSIKMNKEEYEVV